MSKFIDALSAFETGGIHPDYPEICTNIETKVNPSYPFKTRKQYRISTKWTAFVSSNPEDLPKILLQIKKALKREIYRELIPLLHQLQPIIYASVSVDEYPEIKILFDKIWEEIL